MPTRFYWESGTPAVTPTTWSAGWNSTGSASTNNAATTIPTAFVGASSLGGTGTSNQFRALLRIVSAPINAQTVTGTFRGAILHDETDATDNYFLAVGIKVITSAGADRGILLAPTSSTSLNEANDAVPRIRTFRDASDNQEITLGSVSASNTDRIVIEVGFHQFSTSTSNGGVQSSNTTNFQGPVGYTNANTGSTSEPGIAWFQFSQDIAGLTTVQGSGIFYIGEGTTPADGAAAANAADPTAVTPPDGMEAGDLVFMTGQQRATSATLAVSATGGQSWTSETAIGATNVTARLFWCIFNGTWSADPSVDFSAATCNSVQMHVFRPPSGSTFALNQAQQEDDNATAPHTITGQTTTGTDPTLTFAGWFSADDNTWGSISGAGWEVVGYNQYRNTSGQDQSATFAAFMQATGGATGNVTKTQATLGDDPSTCFIISFAAAPNVPKSLVLSSSRLFQNVQLVR